jgi:hypothetical protein
LDGRAREGRWIGYDLDSINGHRIYYPDNRSIRVEQSVKFPEVKRSGEIYRVLNEGEKVEIWVKENLESIQHAPVIALQPIPTASHLPTPSSPLTTPPSTPPRNSESTPIAPRDISSAIDPRNIVEGTRTRRAAHVADAEDDDLHLNVGMESAYLGMGGLSDSPTVEEAMRRED